MFQRQEQRQLEIMDADAGISVEVPYLIYVPDEFDPHSEQFWPLVLFLHGSGERGHNLEDVCRQGLPREIEAGLTLPCIVISPQCAQDAWWSANELTVLLDHLLEHLPIDPNRVYLTGLSMGGFGTWSLAAAFPERFAAIAPICGGGDLESMGRLINMPIWAFHGAQDVAVPLARSADLIHALYNLGGNPRFSVYPDAGHDSWTQTYQNLKLYDWLLDHRK